MTASSNEKTFNLNDPELYVNREVSWLEFNCRVMHEAEDPRNPLLERVKFAAIAGSNLDEFFMKRIGGLKQQLEAGVRERTVDGKTPAEQIEACYSSIRSYQKLRDKLLKQLWRELATQGIRLRPYDRLPKATKEQVRQDYYENIFPLITPQSIDPAHPFPFISNLSLNLLVTLRYPGDDQLSLARVKVPVGSGAPRFLPLPDGQYHFVLLGEVVAANLDLLFPGMEIVNCETFRVTRNANTERSEECADDLMALIESELKDRKFAPIVRLQIGSGMDPVNRGQLSAELGLDEQNEVFEVDEMMGMRDLMEIAQLPITELHDEPHHPIDHPDLQSSRNIFHIIRDARAILLQRPYESFSSSLERFLR